MDPFFDLNQPPEPEPTYGGGEIGGHGCGSSGIGRESGGGTTGIRPFAVCRKHTAKIAWHRQARQRRLCRVPYIGAHGKPARWAPQPLDNVNGWRRRV